MLQNYVANLRSFLFVREHDGDFIGYNITVVKLACLGMAVAVTVYYCAVKSGGLTWKEQGFTHL